MELSDHVLEDVIEAFHPEATVQGMGPMDVADAQGGTAGDGERGIRTHHSMGRLHKRGSERSQAPHRPLDDSSCIDENYRVITLILKKYGNLPLCLKNYTLFSLP